jgi:hypothetical protein
MEFLDLLQNSFFRRHHHTGFLACSSDISLTHEPRFATAAAALESSAAQSVNSASSAVSFLTDAISRLAAAYEQASVCTLAAHSLRLRSPCSRPEDIMRCCVVASAVRSLSDASGDEIPYPVVCGSDFEIGTVPALREIRQHFGGTDSAPDSSPNRKRPEPEELGSPRLVEDHESKRLKTNEQDAEAMGTAVSEQGSAPESTSGIYSRDTRQTPQAAAASAISDFGWLPGDGVFPCDR